MTEEPGNQITTLPSGGALKTTSGAARVRSNAILDALKIAPSKLLTEINGIFFNNESIKQLEIWSKTLLIDDCKIIGIEEISRILCSEYYNLPEIRRHGSWQDSIFNGAITEVNFPQYSKWEKGKLDLSFLSKINKLYCMDNNLTELDLSRTPELTILFFSGNQLNELNLSNTPRLIELDCSFNQLIMLKLSGMPGLTELICNYNELTELDLSYTPGLTELDCECNELTELDLSYTPGLTKLNCVVNQLTELDIRNNPNLSDIEVDDGVRIIKHDWQLRDN